MITNEPYSIVK